MNNEQLNAAKDKAAREIEGYYGKFKDWQDVSDHGDMNEIEAVINRAMEIYASQQRTEGIREGFEAARDMTGRDIQVTYSTADDYLNSKK